jgi:hypothetical protein
MACEIKRETKASARHECELERKAVWLGKRARGGARGEVRGCGKQRETKARVKARLLSLHQARPVERIYLVLSER